MVNQLTKKSSENEIKAYFTEVLKLAQSNEQFPVNLDDVWPLVYARKDKAVRALKDCELFMQGLDYQVFPKNGERINSPLPQNGERIDSPLAQNGKRSANGQFNGSNKETYYLSLPCLEFFIARKVRPVFDVYREVFHKVASGAFVVEQPKASGIPPIPDIRRNVIGEGVDSSVIPNQHDTLLPLYMFYNHIVHRFCRVARQSCHNKSVMEVYDRFESQYQDFRMTVSNLTYIEEVMAIEGAGALVEGADGKEIFV